MGRAEAPEPDRARDQQETAVGACDKTGPEVPSTDVEGAFYDVAFYDADLVRS